MIAQNCKYNYSADKYLHFNIANLSSWQDIAEVLDTKIVNDIAGYKDAVIIKTKASFLVGIDNRPISESSTYICKYDTAMVKNLFGISAGLDNIINTHVGHNCESGEQAAVWLMAKVLGNKNE